MFQKLKKTACFIYDPTYPKELERESEYPFLARATSVDRVENLNSKKFPGESAFTVGKMHILENMIGELPEIITFERDGGFIKVKDYYKFSLLEFLKKMNRGQTKNGLPRGEEDESYMEIQTYEEDFRLKAGDVYLIYASLDKDRPNRYMIEGFAYGSLKLKENGEPLEKVNLKKKKKITVGNKWQVQNEVTKEKQDLEEYLKKELGIEVEEK